MTEIKSDVRFIKGQDDMIPDSHVYLLGDPSGGDISLVDAGLMGKGPYKIESIKRMGIRLDDVKRIIMTHTHLDHIGCLSEIMEEIPNAELWVHEDEARFLEEGDDRTVYGMEMFKSMCQAQYGLKEGAFKISVDRKLKGGEKLDLGGTAWEVIHIQGTPWGGSAYMIRGERS